MQSVEARGLTVTKIRKTIEDITRLYRENPNRWRNERAVHYEFFFLLFERFDPEEIKKNFMWELPVGVPSYGNRVAYVDLAFKDAEARWIAIEIEHGVSPGVSLGSELEKCVLKLETAPRCADLIKGFIVPLVCRFPDHTATNKPTKLSYKELIWKNICDAENHIQRDDIIEIVKSGVVDKRTFGEMYQQQS